MTDPTPQPWHLALAYAVSGERIEGLGDQLRPDPAALAAELETRAAAGELILRPGTAAAVPAQWRAGLGAAQLAASIAALNRALGLDARRSVAISVDRPLDADERRLSADVPPHHHAR